MYLNILNVLCILCHRSAPDESFVTHTPASLMFEHDKKLFRNFYRHRDFVVDLNAIEDILKLSIDELKGKALWEEKSQIESDLSHLR